jgi:hypothetical protein
LGIHNELIGKSYTNPAKPIKAIDKIPAVVSAAGIPSIYSGRWVWPMANTMLCNKLKLF